MQKTLLLPVLFTLTSSFLIGQSASDSLSYYKERGMDAYDRGLYRDAEFNLVKAAEWAKEKNMAEYVEILNDLGNIAGYVAEPEKAINYYQEVLRNITSSSKPRELESMTLKNIGATYSDLKDFKNGLAYLGKAEVIARELNNKELIADCLNNRGIIYEQTDSTDEALESYTQALQYYRELKNPERLALVFLNIGVLSKQLQQWENAAAAYDSALHYSRVLGNEFYIAATLNNLGNVLAGMKRYDEGIKLTMEALEISRKIGQPDLEQNCLSSLAEQYHAKGDNKNAYQWQLKFVALHDSIINIERVNSLTEMETRFGVEKNELELQRVTAQEQLAREENKKSQLYQVLLLVVLLAVVATSLAFFRIRNLRQKKKEIEIVARTEKQERERIAKDMHDELGSGIARITWITATTERSVTDENVRKQIHAIEGIADQLSSGMKSLIWLLNVGNSEWNVLSGRLREMASQFAEEFGFKLHFETSGLKDEWVVKQEVARDIFLICKEAMNNISKHSKANKVEMAFNRSSDELNIRISDDGRGFDPAQVKRGYGLRNIEQRILSMGGDVSLTSATSRGTAWNIRLPLKGILHA